MTLRANVGAASGGLDAFDGSLALSAWFALSAVDTVPELKPTPLTGRCAIVADQMPGLERFWQVQARANASRIFNFYQHVMPVFPVEYAKTEATATVRYFLALLSGKVERFFVPGYAIDPFKDLWQPGPRIFNVDGRLNPNASALSNEVSVTIGTETTNVL